MARADLIDLIDIGLESEADVTAGQIATELDLGLTPRLPAVVTDGTAVATGANGTGITPSLPADVVDAIARSTALAADISKQLQANMDMGNEQADALADAIVTNVEADQIIALVADTADLKAENRTDEIFEALGGHAAQVDRAKDAREFEIQLEALSEKRADILDDKHVGISIIDDVINGFRVQKTEAALEITAQQAAQNQQDIVNATATTQAASQTNALVKQTANEGTIAANQRKIASAGQSELYNATLVQNRSNAETLKTVLSVSDREMGNIMRGYELAGSIENRQIARERHELALSKFVQDTAFSEISARRNIIGLERDRLQLRVDEGTVDAKIQSQLVALERAEVGLDREIIALTVDDTTLDDRLAASIIARRQAEVNLDASALALDREQDPAKEAALQAINAAAITASERAEFEFNELQETSDLRLAQKTGAVRAQELNNEILGINARAAKLLEAGRTTEALALLDDARKKRVDTAVVKADNAATVQAYQSFIFGAHAVETSEVINSQLDSGNTLYALMRQLGSARGPNGEFILGTTPAKANTNLTLMEQHGIISNDIAGIKILREVRSVLQRKHEEEPHLVPTDDIGRAIEFNATARKYMEDKGTEIVFGDVTNPLQPPTIPQMAELSPTLAQQPLFSEVLTPENNEDTNVDTIIAKGIVAMQAGTLSQEQVIEGIVAMGNVIALNSNINHHGMQTVGLPYISSVNMRVMKPKVLTSIFTTNITSLQDITPFRDPLDSAVRFTTLDITDQVQVRQHLISMLASTIFEADLDTAREGK